MRRLLIPLVASAAILTLMVAPAMAQTSPTPPAPAAPGAPGLEPAPRMPSPPVEKIVDGPVKKVDPANKTVQVGWGFGLFRTTLEVTDDTRVAALGGKGSLTDIREGDRVKASYEYRDGKNIAKSIEVMPAEKKAAPPQQSQGGTSAPPIGAKTQ